MLKSLKVNNYAIIENLEINFSSGFNIITGETGAGKSILIGALGLIMGNRADTKVLFDLNQKCIVEANFDITAYDLNSFFSENELDYEADLILRREILPNSKSRAFVNDTPVNLKVVRELTGFLLDMHQQFDTLGLNNPEVQMNLLDAYAGNFGKLNSYGIKYHEYQTKRQKLSRLIAQKKQAEKDQELLTYHLEEFEKLGLEVGQLKSLEQELSVLENAESIKATLAKLSYSLNEAEPSIISSLEELNYELAKISKFHPSIEKLSDRYIGTIEELRALSGDFENQSEATDLDPTRLGEIQEKIDLAYQIQAKHHLNSEEEMMAKWEEISDKISAFKQSDDAINQMQEAIANVKAELDILAEQISKKRIKTAPILCKKVENHLHQLSMENAKFQIDIQVLDELVETGKNEIKFLFSANIGARLQEINEVASGGELSRLSLCIKSELANTIKLPTLIFDEIDSGVSGAISMKMGRMIKSLTESHQIINITHSPQIAARADKHYRIFKEDSKNRSYTKMEILEGEFKTLEIAKMLSGDPPSEAAIENAKALMADNN